MRNQATDNKLTIFLIVFLFSQESNLTEMYQVFRCVNKYSVSPNDAMMWKAQGKLVSLLCKKQVITSHGSVTNLLLTLFGKRHKLGTHIHNLSQ